MSDPQMSLSEAVLAMLAMVIVLCFVLFYYCILPCYNNYKKHHWTREQATGEDWESDPRWNNHKFQFVPRKPADYLTDKKYSRLGACSRTSSMRSNNPLLDGAQDMGETNPSNLDVEASKPVIPSLTGKVKLTKKPPKYSEIYKTNDKTGSVGSVSSTNTSSLSSPPEYSSKTPSVEMNLNQDNSPKDQIKPQPTLNGAGGKPPRQKIRFEKPKKNKKEPQTPSADGNQSGACSPDTTKESV